MHAHIHTVCVCVCGCVCVCVHWCSPATKRQTMGSQSLFTSQTDSIGKIYYHYQLVCLGHCVCVPVHACIAFWFMDVSLSVCMWYIHVWVYLFQCVRACSCTLVFFILGKNTLIIYCTATPHHVLKGQNITMLVFVVVFPLQNTWLCSHILVLYLSFVYNNWWDYRHFFLWSNSGQHW